MSLFYDDPETGIRPINALEIDGKPVDIEKQAPQVGPLPFVELPPISFWIREVGGQRTPLIGLLTIDRSEKGKEIIRHEPAE
jgi:hypothetical protein